MVVVVVIAFGMGMGMSKDIFSIIFFFSNSISGEEEEVASLFQAVSSMIKGNCVYGTAIRISMFQRFLDSLISKVL